MEDYDQQRLDNIAKNEKRLRELGLLPSEDDRAAAESQRVAAQSERRAAKEARRRALPPPRRSARVVDIMEDAAASVPPIDSCPASAGDPDSNGDAELLDCLRGSSMGPGAIEHCAALLGKAYVTAHQIRRQDFTMEQLQSEDR